MESMKTVVLTDANTSEVAKEAALILTSGGVVLYPTDTLYGLGADALSNEAVKKVYAIKGRDSDKPIIVLAKDMEMVEQYAELTEEARRLAARFWPGALTLVLRKKSGIETGTVRERNDISIRVPQNTFCHAMSAAYGGLITTTSANISGMPSLRSVPEIVRQLGDKVKLIDLVIDAGTLPSSNASTVVDLSGVSTVILREGAVASSEIAEVLA